jgi:hypothetical protein
MSVDDFDSLNNSLKRLPLDAPMKLVRSGMSTVQSKTSNLKSSAVKSRILNS